MSVGLAQGKLCLQDTLVRGRRVIFHQHLSCQPELSSEKKVDPLIDIQGVCHRGQTSWAWTLGDGTEGAPQAECGVRVGGVSRAWGQGRWGGVELWEK